MRSLQRSMCAAMLTLQAVVLFLTTPVMISVSDVGVPTALAVGLGLTVACLVAAGTLRGPWGYRLGWAIQVASLVLGLVVPIMFVIGAIFAGLWVAAFVLGRRIDVEKAERAGLEEQEAAEHGRDDTAG
jgi:hypothetical protein